MIIVVVTAGNSTLLLCVDEGAPTHHSRPQRAFHARAFAAFTPPTSLTHIRAPRVPHEWSRVAMTVTIGHPSTSSTCSCHSTRHTSVTKSKYQKNRLLPTARMASGIDTSCKYGDSRYQNRPRSSPSSSGKPRYDPAKIALFPQQPQAVRSRRGRGDILRAESDPDRISTRGLCYARTMYASGRL